MLECRNLDVSYGHVRALHGVSLEVPSGRIVTLLGANGAGKTTLLRAISGLERASTGSIIFEGEELRGQRPARIVRGGISQVPAGRQIFGNLTVRENLRLGAYTRTRHRRDQRAVAEDFDTTLEMFPTLGERLTQRAGTMSGGEQQMLAIGRALMAKPRMLMLDEPSLGLAPQIVEGIFTALRRLNREQDLTMILVEQQAHLALDFADWAYVLETGHIVHSAPPGELSEDESIAALYFGADVEAE